MRTRTQCAGVPLAELTLEEFDAQYPHLPCGEHYRAVRTALLMGYIVFDGYRDTYPSLVNVKPRRRNGGA
jgi:hypothetical protein